MKARKLSDAELMGLAADHMPSDLAWKYIYFVARTDFDADDGDTTEQTVDPYAAKVLSLIIGCGPKPPRAVRELTQIDRFTLARIGRLRRASTH